jgi:hypothetical protein
MMIVLKILISAVLLLPLTFGLFGVSIIVLYAIVPRKIDSPYFVEVGSTALLMVCFVFSIVGLTIISLMVH